MTRALRIVLVASLLSLTVALTGGAPAGAATPTIKSISALTTRAGCAVLSNGTAQCSGVNSSGQLGNGTLTTSVNPVQVVGLNSVAQVVTGNFYACARLANGTVDCWGDNTYGQLGTGNFNPSSTPVAVKNAAGNGPLTGVVQIAAGKYHTCARISNGTISCWGHNGYYELGTGNNTAHLLPVQVRSGNNAGILTGEVGVSVGQYHSCAVHSDGSVRCWGLGQFGLLGRGDQKASDLPVRVRAVSGAGFLVNVASVSSAPEHNCVLLKNRTVNCWGLNASGQLGNGTNLTQLRPVLVRNQLGNAALVNVMQISTAGGSDGDHSCARLANSTAQCWGANNFGQLGVGTKVKHLRPSPVLATTGPGPLLGVLGVFAGPLSTCAALNTGNAKCWGYNQGGQFGNGNGHNATKPIPAKP